MRVLALISDYPLPPVTGSRVRNYRLWPEVRKLGVELRVLGLGKPPAGAGTFDGEFFPFDRAFLPVRLFRALTTSYHQHPTAEALRREVERLDEEWKPDVVHAEELRLAAYLPRHARPGRKRTVTMHNVESDLAATTGTSPIAFGAPLINRLHLRNLRAFEREAARAADRIFAYSPDDLRRYQELLPEGRWGLTRGGTAASSLVPPPHVAEPRLLLVGSLSYAPNIRGLFWFLDEVLPRLPEHLPVTVAGSNAVPEVRTRLARSRVRFLDTPPDLAPVYAEHSLCLVPVFEGSGTRGKTLEAMAFRRAIVTTQLGVSGLDLREGEGFVLAETPEAFAAKILALASDEAARRKLAERGREVALERFDWAAVAADLVRDWGATVPR